MSDLHSYCTPFFAKAIALNIANQITSGDITGARDRYLQHLPAMNDLERKVFSKWLINFLLENGYETNLLSE